MTNKKMKTKIKEKSVKAWAVVWKDYFFACPTREETVFFKDWIEDKDKEGKKKNKMRNGEIVPCEILIKSEKKCSMANKGSRAPIKKIKK